MWRRGEKRSIEDHGGEDKTRERPFWGAVCVCAGDTAIRREVAIVGRRRSKKSISAKSLLKRGPFPHC